MTSLKHEVCHLSSSLLYMCFLSIILCIFNSKSNILFVQVRQIITQHCLTRKKKIENKRLDMALAREKGIPTHEHFLN